MRDARLAVRGRSPGRRTLLRIVDTCFKRACAGAAALLCWRHDFDRIEKEMSAAPTEVQWTMNMCLGEIGIHFPKHRKRALAIGEKLGIYRDYPCSKGCTSPFVPIWVNEMVRRQG